VDWKATRPTSDHRFARTQRYRELVLTSRSVGIAYNSAHHRFAVVLACATFLLIIAGALVTSNDAGLSVPDWPTSFGSLYKLPPMVGGVKYEHTHRMIAEFIGLLIIVMAVWTQKVEPRRWMRVLGWTALGAVIGQGILGGITVLHFLPWSISTAHATLAQMIFCIVVAMALFTSRAWLQDTELLGERDLRPSTPVLTVLAAACVWVQLILGAAFRHSGIKLLPHLVGACVVTAMLCWTIARVLTRYGNVDHLRRPAQLLLALLMLQLGLGFSAYLTRLTWGHDAVQPLQMMVVSTVSHVAGGALVLAVTVVLAIQARRMIGVHAMESTAQSAHGKAVIA
jgi:cytochrome c oxidase assembly protein subunit 15